MLEIRDVSTMFTNKALIAVAKSMRGQADALLGAIAILTAPVLLLTDISDWVALGFPLTIFIIYNGTRIALKRQDVKIAEHAADEKLGSANGAIRKRKK